MFVKRLARAGGGWSSMRTVTAALLALAIGGCGQSGADDEAPPASTLTDAADQSYTYLLPLFELGTTRAFYRNLFLHRPTLADASSRDVTTPNNDTLYSSAWLDLSGGPLIINLPASGERYFSLALMDFYSNNFAVRGTRADGGDAKRFWLAGPDWTGSAPDGVEVVRSPTRSVWALGRTYVRDAADIPAALLVQLQLLTLPAPGTSLPLDQPSDLLDKPDRQDWLDYFAYAQQLLNENPSSETTGNAVRTALSRLGIGVAADAGFDPDRFSVAEQAEIAAGAQRAFERARDGAVGAERNGWISPQAHLGNFGSDYTYRAAIALFGLGALPNEEALYFFGAGDEASQRYDGNQRYVMEFAGGALPPVGAFWSLTLYEAEDDGQLFFYDNPQRRYAIKSGDSSLRYEADGGLKIYLGHAAPPPGYENNWLPAPAGPFATAFRTYLPDASLLDGRYRLPPLRRLE